MTRALCLALVCSALAAPAAADGPKSGASASEATLDLYRSKCQQCHLADGNSPLQPLNFADGKWKHGSRSEDVVKVITNGVPTTAMLPFKAQLTADEIADLAAYVRSFDKTTPKDAKSK